MSVPIHQEILFSATSERVYEALTDSSQFGNLTDAPAEIGSNCGSAFSCFGGMVIGRHLELIPNEMIVQARRITSWDAGAYSIARFKLKSQGDHTLLVFDHTGYPEGEFEHLDRGWHKMYWEPIKKHLDSINLEISQGHKSEALRKLEEL